VAGHQYKDLYDGLVSVFADDGSKIGTAEFDMLTGWHTYLETINNTEGETAYNKAFAEGMSELRGDVYATVRKRIESVQNAFDSSFTELSDAYNISKNSSKYAVIWNQGKYADETVGIDDYKYSVQGLMYMNEREGRNYGNKWGWYTGFAVGNFDFEDGQRNASHSDERMYSFRLGLHNVRSIGDNDKLRLVTRVEGAYNRHETTRIIELDKVYRNKGRFESYGVLAEARLEKVLSRSERHKLELYGGVKTSYGRTGDFTESGDGLTVQVKGKNYYSLEASLGIKGQYKAYVGKKVGVKLTGDLGYAREFNENSYKRMEARIANGSAEYYELIRPSKEKGNFRGKLGLSIERANKAAVNFSVEGRKYENKSKPELRFGVGFTYKFGF